MFLILFKNIWIVLKKHFSNGCLYCCTYSYVIFIRNTLATVNHKWHFSNSCLYCCTYSYVIFIRNTLATVNHKRQQTRHQQESLPLLPLTIALSIQIWISSATGHTHSSQFSVQRILNCCFRRFSFNKLLYMILQP